MEAVDTLIRAPWIIPVEPRGTVLEDHVLAVHEGRIHDILPAAEAGRRYRAQSEVSLARHVLIPGLVNAHTHAAMTLFRGLADDLPLMEWLNEHIWPAEGTWVNSEFVHDGSLLAIAEMLRGGTTCFNDMYFFPEETARAAETTGIRAAIGLIMIDFPTAWAADAEEYLAKGLALQDRYRNHPLISTVFAPHAPYTVSDGPLEKIVTYAEEVDIPIHMHVHETAAEVEGALEQHGERPLARLRRLGLLTPRLLAVHMTQLEADDIALLAESGAHVVHCPESNLKLASGFCPVARLLEAGVNVALGTDGAASNNDLDMLGEMRSAALLAKAVAGDASALPAADALRMATLGGARALGLDGITGSLEKGKAADVVAVDLGEIEAQPLYHPLSQLVYTAARHQVSDVWVAGRHLLKERRLTTVDEQALLARCAPWREKIGRSDEQHQAAGKETR
ncbi:MAG TPA: TRZ/ATZ family hydrolase [Gammaproteobacteria bacterium]|nr:TRZ/ATZ family hydrolase [Gammaproteobacteria bacterium]